MEKWGLGPAEDWEGLNVQSECPVCLLFAILEVGASWGSVERASCLSLFSRRELQSGVGRVPISQLQLGKCLRVQGQ